MHAPILALLAALSAATAAQEAPRDGTLLVLLKSANELQAVDPGGGASRGLIATGKGPHEVAVSPDGRTAVVADYGAQVPGSTLSVYDLATGRLARTIDLGEHRRPHGIQYLPDGERVAVTTEVSQSVLVVHVSEARVERAIPTGQKVTHMLVVSPDGKRAYASSIGSGTLAALDLERGELLGVVATGKEAEGLDITPDGREVWVGNRAEDTLSVVDTKTLEVAARLDCAQFPIRLKITPDGRHALVSNAESGDVAVFDVARREELRRIPMQVDASEDAEGRMFAAMGKSPVPIGILIEPSGRRAFVANTNADVVTVLDLAEWKVADRFATGREPDGLGWTPLRFEPRPEPAGEQPAKPAGG